MSYLWLVATRPYEHSHFIAFSGEFLIVPEYFMSTMAFREVNVYLILWKIIENDDNGNQASEKTKS